MRLNNIFVCLFFQVSIEGNRELEGIKKSPSTHITSSPGFCGLGSQMDWQGYSPHRFSVACQPRLTHPMTESFQQQKVSFSGQALSSLCLHPFCTCCIGQNKTLE